ncbi:MAG: VWA domain-containing protein [Deltaproteobacteria bacterium]|nr:VWA domain-containing protein [Deltaproteobacteria bacterium]
MRARNHSRLFWLAIIAGLGLTACGGGLSVTEEAMSVDLGAIDVLFVIDNSGSMVGEQLQLAHSFERMAERLDLRLGQGRYRIGVVTTGMASPGCPDCNVMITHSCVNETGESGALQDRLGRIEWNEELADFDFVRDPRCAEVEAGELDCLLDPDEERSIALVGVNGCGYERGLEALRSALDGQTNPGFLRADAMLAVVVVSDEEDCGAVGDVTESVPGKGAELCYHAAAGVDPDGQPASRLTPVADYHAFLTGLKDRPGRVRFAAVVGVADPSDPLSTKITYDAQGQVEPACRTPGCSGGAFCEAYPGTRYIELARLFGLGQDGQVETICQADFSPVLDRLGAFMGCPASFPLPKRPRAEIQRLTLGNVDLPRYSCEHDGRECRGPEDTSCHCLETWKLDSNHVLTLAPHVDRSPICDLIDSGRLDARLGY